MAYLQYASYLDSVSHAEWVTSSFPSGGHPAIKVHKSYCQRAYDTTIAVPEEIAFGNGWVFRERLLECAERYGKSNYGAHLRTVAEGKIRPDHESHE